MKEEIEERQEYRNMAEFNCSLNNTAELRKQEREYEKKCCRNCKYHVRGGVPGEGEVICNNGESGEYGLETLYNHYCEEYEER